MRSFLGIPFTVGMAMLVPGGAFLAILLFHQYLAFGYNSQGFLSITNPIIILPIMIIAAYALGTFVFGAGNYFIRKLQKCLFDGDVLLLPLSVSKSGKIREKCSYTSLPSGDSKYKPTVMQRARDVVTRYPALPFNIIDEKYNYLVKPDDDDKNFNEKANEIFQKIIIDASTKTPALYEEVYSRKALAHGYRSLTIVSLLATVISAATLVYCLAVNVLNDYSVSEQIYLFCSTPFWLVVSVFFFLTSSRFSFVYSSKLWLYSVFYDCK
jgi:hypothetical protein